MPLTHHLGPTNRPLSQRSAIEIDGSDGAYPLTPYSVKRFDTAASGLLARFLWAAR